MGEVCLVREDPANHLTLATAYNKLGLTELESEAMVENRRLLEEHLP